MTNVRGNIYHYNNNILPVEISIANTWFRSDRSYWHDKRGYKYLNSNKLLYRVFSGSRKDLATDTRLCIMQSAVDPCI